MSLGLDDLKKRSSTKKRVEDAQPQTAAKSREDFRNAIKPWSNRGLARAGVSRKQSVGFDFHINEDWIEIQAQSFFWINLNFDFEHLHEETGLRLQRKLSAIDKKIVSSVEKLKNLVRFFGLSTKPST
jgi:hypothetical protein